MVRDALYPSDDDGNDSSQSDDEEDEEVIVDVNAAPEIIPEKKKPTVVINAHKTLLKELSSNFTMPYGEIGVRDHPSFSPYLSD